MTTTDRRPSPEDVPQSIVHAAKKAWLAAPQKRNGAPTRMRYAIAAVADQVEERFPGLDSADEYGQGVAAVLRFLRGQE